MTCACGNTARYIAETGALVCGICPLKRGEDSIRIADVPALLRWARRYLGGMDLMARPSEELRAIVGRHPGRNGR